MSQLPPIPTDSELEGQSPDNQGRMQRTGFISDDWFNWFRTLVDRVNVTPQRLKVTRLQEQEASIATTALGVPSLGSGLYRVSVRARITRPATVNSSLSVTIGWTEGGVPQSQSLSAAMTGNTTATTNLPLSILMRIDTVSAITFATAYVSVGATTMQYDVEIVVEAVPV